jgi:hypothetical protein
MTDFWTAANSGNLPAVTFLKATSNSTGHPANSSPLAEQQFLVSTNERSRLRRQTLRVRGTAAMWW